MIDAREVEPVQAIRALTGRGVDASLESTGRPDVLRQAVDSLGARGTCVVLGAPRMGTTASFDVIDLISSGKVIRGAMEGDSVPDIFIPQLIELHRQGRFPFDRLIRFYPFDCINAAAADSRRGGAIKPVLRLPQ